MPLVRKRKSNYLPAASLDRDPKSLPPPLVPRAFPRARNLADRIKGGGKR